VSVEAEKEVLSEEKQETLKKLLPKSAGHVLNLLKHMPPKDRDILLAELQEVNKHESAAEEGEKEQEKEKSAEAKEVGSGHVASLVAHHEEEVAKAD